MNIDIRVDTSWLTHRKRWRLQDALGGDGIAAIIDLWIYAAIHCPNDGILRGLNERDIIRVSQFKGTGDLVKTLSDPEILFLDPPTSTRKDYKLHNWRERQPYLAHSRERSVKASTAAKAKHLQAKKVCGEHASSTAKTKIKHAPAPNPFPVPSPSPNPDLKSARVQPVENVMSEGAAKFAKNFQDRLLKVFHSKSKTQAGAQ
jgi:hypothetical protein